MGWTFYNSSGQQLRNTGTVLATQAEMETGTALTSFVTPGRTQYHPGVAKAWCRVSDAGVLESPSYNIASVTDTGTGDRTIVIDTDFSTDDVYVVIEGSASTGTDIRTVQHDSYAVGSFRHKIMNNAASGLIDRHTTIAIFGDQ